MAYADYRLCDICDAKTFYDANLNYERDDTAPDGLKLYGLGDWSVICEKCAETHKTTIVRKDAAEAK